MEDDGEAAEEEEEESLDTGRPCTCLLLGDQLDLEPPLLEVKTEPGGRLQLPRRPDLLHEDRLRGGAVKRVHAEAGGSVDIGDYDGNIEITFPSSTESLSPGPAAKIPRKEAKQSLEWCLPCPPGTPAEPAGGCEEDLMVIITF